MKRTIIEASEYPGLSKKTKLDFSSAAIDDDSDDESGYTASTPFNPIDTPSTSFSPASSKWPSDLKTIKCTFPGCEKTFNRPARLAAHERSHRNERPFKCTFPDCDKDYLEEKHLKQHIKSSHTNERKYVCEQSDCGKQFLTATRLRRHQLVHEGQERYKCRDFPPCDKSFRKHQTLQRHIRVEHEHRPAFPCNHKDSQSGEICMQGFDTSGSLRRHQERDHGEKRFWCEECATQTDSVGNPHRVGFPTIDLLQAHMKQSHVKCMFCGQQCNGKDQLEQHVETQHTTPQKSVEERKTVACPWQGCTKTFTRKSNLNVHIRSVHEGLRFVCGEFDLSKTEHLFGWTNAQGCGKGFPLKSSLENHVRYVHLKYERPEPASAGSQTREPRQQNGATMLEQLTGVGEKSRRTMPCQFEGCSMTFAYTGDLEAHVLIDHGQTVADSMATLASNPATPAFFEDAAPDMNEWGSGAVADPNGDFWFGADSNVEATGGFHDEWLRDEAEMRKLIGADELDDLIDPSLALL
ncbi:transcription factor IIIA [Xylariaceae sp. FL0255]|nr:transcription factor IIIA [Xylariaceae sp. FL0255]